MSNAVVKLKDRALRDLIEAFKWSSHPKARVGVFGKPNTDTGEQVATYGAAHEYGTTNLPQRSFLRVPLADLLDRRLAYQSIFSKAFVNKIIEKKSLIFFIQAMAAVAEGIVKEAFMTNGFGKWKKLRAKTIKYKKAHKNQILVETRSLRNAITSKVIK